MKELSIVLLIVVLVSEVWAIHLFTKMKRNICILLCLLETALDQIAMQKIKGGLSEEEKEELGIV